MDMQIDTKKNKAASMTLASAMLTKLQTKVKHHRQIVPAIAEQVKMK